MDGTDKLWHFSDMQPVAPPRSNSQGVIPAWNLYGESQTFPDVLHIETITNRAAGLDWQIAPHRHPHLHQFLLLLNGTVTISFDGVSPPVEPPFLLSVPQGVVHGFTFSAGTFGWVLTVPLQTLPELLEPTFMRETALGQAGLCAPDDTTIALFTQIYDEHAGNEPARAMMLRSLAAQIACHVLRRLDPTKPPGDSAPDPRFLQFQALLNQHLRDNWKVPDFARAIGLSERHLSRICRIATGRPAAELIESAIMREACRLLVYTRASVASIGYGLGFEDPSYFSRAFRRVMGLSPGTYRAGFDRD